MSERNPDETGLERWGGGTLGASPKMEFSDPSDAYGYAPSTLGAELERYGVTPEVVGKQPDEVDAKWLGNIYRYQFFSEYLYQAGPEDGPTEIAPIQFRTSIYTVGQPSQALMDFLADHVNGRQKTLFDTGAYQDYFTNWMPFEGGYNENVEGPERVGPEEVEAALGVPFFEVEIYDEDYELRGEARGYANPFSLVEHQAPPAPQYEKWKVGKNEARGYYEFQPTGDAKTRLKGLNKTVSLNGRYIGTVYSSRGTVEIKDQYASDDQTTTHRKTGMLRHSRQFFIDNDIFHPNALQKNGAVWKVSETEDHIELVANKPDGFAADPVDATATGTAVFELALDETVPTDFEVRADHEIYAALGRYHPPTERSIEEETEFEVYDPASDTYLWK